MHDSAKLETTYKFYTTRVSLLEKGDHVANRGVVEAVTAQADFPYEVTFTDATSWLTRDIPVFVVK